MRLTTTDRMIRSAYTRYRNSMARPRRDDAMDGYLAA